MNSNLNTRSLTRAEAGICLEGMAGWNIFLFIGFLNFLCFFCLVAYRSFITSSCLCINTQQPFKCALADSLTSLTDDVLLPSPGVDTPRKSRGEPMLPGLKFLPSSQAPELQYL